MRLFKQALDIADANPERNFAIFSETYSALRKIKSFQTEDVLIRGGSTLYL